MADEIILTDMGKCAPGDAMRTNATADAWQLVDYEAGELTGKMIIAQPTVDAPDVSLPLEATGWHAISVGGPPINRLSVYSGG